MVPLSHRAQDNRRLPGHIKRIHDGSDGMRQQGLYGVPQRKRWRKKVSGQQPGDVHNHL
jgi:putative transposase